ncbi:MAG: YceD family protein [Acidobacteriota bacterium]
MKINISGLSTGFHTFEVSQSAQTMDLPGNFLGDVTVRVSLEKTSWQILATIRATVNASFQCDRCADDFTAPIDVTFDAVYSWDETDRSAAEDENFFILAEGQNAIDLTDVVREYLVLAVPAKTLCREECRGLCPVCGTNLNEHTCDCRPGEHDGRWDALQKLVS